MDQVEARINAACARSGRIREEVQVIAVTKYVSLETTKQVFQQGLEHIGENRWQDARMKWDALGSQGVWHFIGHLQSNKVKDVLGKFQYIHSLDRMNLAQEINKKAAFLGLTVHCFIQVNVSGEASKEGLNPDQLISFTQEISELSGLRIVGLMCMAPYELEAELTRPIFSKLRQLRDRLNENGILSYHVPHLSMGMSNDFEVAIEEGATWVRLGSVLVGKE